MSEIVTTEETQEFEPDVQAARSVWLRALGERLTENGVILYDTEGRPVLANDSACRILGRSVTLGLPLEDHIQALGLEEDDHSPLGRHEHPVTLALRGVETHDRQVFVGRSTGNARATVLADASPTRGDDGRVRGALLVLRDHDEVERAQAFREAFLARAGHELRNPLAALVTASQVLERRAKKRGDAPDRALEIVVESVQNLQKLVEDLLDLSRIGRGRFELRRSRTPLGAILLAAAEDVRGKHPGEAKIDVLVAGDIVTGMWDPDRLRQLVRNIIDNAVVHGRPPVDVKVVTLGEDRVCFRIRDRGEGVPVERREEVLKPFVRRDRDVGLGLGLAIASEIARAHGGRLWVGDPDDMGKGCAVFVELPLASS